MAGPQNQPESQPQTGAAPQDLVNVSGDQIRQALAQKQATPDVVAMIAQDLQLSPGEVARLRAGAPLTMTPAQYASIVAGLTQAFARPAKRAEGGATTPAQADGDFCSCNGSPTPTPAPTGHVPAVTSTTTGLTETNAGTTRVDDTVGTGAAQGHVMLRTGVVGINPTRVGSFAISYRGPDSQNAHWLQFIWREVIGVHADNSSHPVAGTLQTTGAFTYELCTSGNATTVGTPGVNNYNTDSADASNPFYEAAGRNTRTADATTIYDQPVANKPKMEEAVAAGATRVVSRAHFNTFLIQNDHVTYAVQTNVEWSLTADQISAMGGDINANPGTQTAGTSGAATALPALMAQRLHQQYPAFNFIS